MRTPKCYRRSNVMSDNSLKKFKSTYQVILGKYEAFSIMEREFMLSIVPTPKLQRTILTLVSIMFVCIV